MNIPKSVYIHIPFCEQICHYCDFNKVYLKGQPVEQYLDAIYLEMKHMTTAYPYEEIETVYIGGGTPSTLSEKQLEQLLTSIHRYFKLNKRAEITMELNPGSTSDKKLAVLQEYGVNRLSIGVQAFQDELLKKIGRIHRSSEIVTTINHARRNGFENISIDLMFGLPGQTVDMFQDTILRAMDLQIPHISAYSLKIEEKTVFHQLLRKGQLRLPSEDEEVTMFERLIDTLIKHDYEHYEISNFSKRNFESKHNLTYWNNDPYYGIGAGAHGYVKDFRHGNALVLKKYIQLVQETGSSIVEKHHVSEKESMEEQWFLGLRKLKGVSMEEFERRFHKSANDIFGKEISKLKEQGLLQEIDGHICLTRQGVFVANEVFEKFLL